MLASNFDAMINEIIAHRKELEARLIEIQRMQEYLTKLLATMSDGGPQRSKMFSVCLTHESGSIVTRHKVRSMR